MKKKFLITGINSGLGKYFYETLGGMGLTRENRKKLLRELQREGVETIIHAAFNPKNVVSQNETYAYLDDNLFLLQELLQIPHQKFIYISSVDVYPKNGKLHDETETLYLEHINLYGQMKLLSEATVQKHTKNFLILRCAAFLGPCMRPNSLLRIYQEKTVSLSIAPDSVFNYVLSQDVIDFIQKAIQEDLRGIYNITSSKNIVFSEVAGVIQKYHSRDEHTRVVVRGISIEDSFKKNIQFGKFKYDVGKICNQKASSILPAFQKTSHEVVLGFLKMIS